MVRGNQKATSQAKAQAKMAKAASARSTIGDDVQGNWAASMAARKAEKEAAAAQPKKLTKLQAARLAADEAEAAAVKKKAAAAAQASKPPPKPVVAMTSLLFLPSRTPASAATKKATERCVLC